MCPAGDDVSVVVLLPGDRLRIGEEAADVGELAEPVVLPRSVPPGMGVGAQILMGPNREDHGGAVFLGVAQREVDDRHLRRGVLVVVLRDEVVAPRRPPHDEVLARVRHLGECPKPVTTRIGPAERHVQIGVPAPVPGCPVAPCQVSRAVSRVDLASDPQPPRPRRVGDLEASVVRWAGPSPIGHSDRKGPLANDGG